MTTSTGIQLTIGPSLATDTKAVQAIHEAMDFLHRQPGFGSPSMSASWQAHGRDGEQVEFLLSERYDTRNWSSRRLFPRAHLYAPQLRDIWALRVWRGLLSLRIDHNQDQIRGMVYELSREEAVDGGAANGGSVGGEG